MVNAVHTDQRPTIELRRLHRFFGKTKAVNDVSFEVYRGQVFGFIGPNGAGKTTSMRILSTLELPSYGDAFINGISSITDPDLVRKNLGFMPDGFSVYRNMNCVEYLDFFARAYGLIGSERVSALKKTLAFTGLDKIASKSITGLSKGMRQRLCLGRAMLHNPSVLILDEPANGLDPRARIELRRMIQELASDGTTILVSSHILTELAEMCDQIGIIEQGKLITVGAVNEIRSQLAGDIEINIKCIEKQSELQEWLKLRYPQKDIQISGETLCFQLPFDPNTNIDKTKAHLLTAMTQAGFMISEFRSQQASLEDVFMKITTGAVQ